MRHSLPIAALLLALAGCAPDVVDVSRLPEPYREWAIEAARIEGVTTTTHGHGWEWTVRLDSSLPSLGRANVQLEFCQIRVNPTRLGRCGDQPARIQTTFTNTMRHELRHCSGQFGHSNNPDRLMFTRSPCDPTD